MRRGAVGVLALLVTGGLALGAGSTERGPEQVLPIVLPVWLPETESELPLLARGEVDVPADCPLCYLHRTQYRFVVPSGAVRLVLELRDATRPDGELDLMLRYGARITEDEDVYYFTWRTLEPGANDRLELRSADAPEGLPPGEYFLGVVSLVENGDRFEVRGACYLPEPFPIEIALSPNRPAEGVLPPGGVFPGLDCQFAFAVPEAASALVLCVQGEGGPVEVHWGSRPAARSPAGGITSEHSTRMTDADDPILVPDPPPGRCWIVLSNPTERPRRFRLTAVSVPVLVPLAPGSEVEGAVDLSGDLIGSLSEYLRTESGTLGLVQYRLDLPLGTVQLSLSCSGRDGLPVRLHVREGRPVEVTGGQPRASLSLEPAPVAVALLQGRLLSASGPLFVAIEAASGSPVSYELCAEIQREGERRVSLVAGRRSGLAPIGTGASGPPSTHRNQRWPRFLE